MINSAKKNPLFFLLKLRAKLISQFAFYILIETNSTGCFHSNFLKIHQF